MEYGKLSAAERKLAGVAMRYKRWDSGLTQEQLAQKVGTSSGTLSQIETGSIKPSENVGRIVDNIVAEFKMGSLTAAIQPPIWKPPLVRAMERQVQWLDRGSRSVARLSCEKCGNASDIVVAKGKNELDVGVVARFVHLSWTLINGALVCRTCRESHQLRSTSTSVVEWIRRGSRWIARLHCPQCDSHTELPFNQKYSETEVLVMALRSHNWSRQGSRFVCRICTEKWRRKKADHAMTITPSLLATKTVEPTSPPDTTTVGASLPASKAHRQLFAMLEMHFDEHAGRYGVGWNDERLAEHVGLSVERVAAVREECFGEMRDERWAHKLELKIAEVRARLKAQLPGITSVINDLSAIVQLANDEVEKLDAIETSVGQMFSEIKPDLDKLDLKQAGTAGNGVAREKEARAATEARPTGTQRPNETGQAQN